jgi:hypothetical protein
MAAISMLNNHNHIDYIELLAAPMQGDNKRNVVAGMILDLVF